MEELKHRAFDQGKEQKKLIESICNLEPFILFSQMFQHLAYLTKSLPTTQEEHIYHILETGGTYCPTSNTEFLER